MFILFFFKNQILRVLLSSNYNDNSTILCFFSLVFLHSVCVTNSNQMTSSVILKMVRKIQQNAIIVMKVVLDLCKLMQCYFIFLHLSCSVDK